MTTRDLVQKLNTQFADTVSHGENNGSGWLSLLQKDGFGRFLEKGFPTNRDEEWRFTDLKEFVSTQFSFSSIEDDKEERARELWKGLGLNISGAYNLVFVNGQVSKSLSSDKVLPDDVVVSSLSEALNKESSRINSILRSSRCEKTPFFNLNEAFLSEGAFVHVPKGVKLEYPIHLIFLTTTQNPIVFHPRNIILAEPSSESRILETYLGDDDTVYWMNTVTEVVAEEEAIVDHYKLQLESKSAFHVANLGVVQSRSSSVSNHSLSLGAKLARNDIRSELGGEGAEVTLNGLYVVKGNQHVDHHTVVEHGVPHCTSRELYKGVLDDEASGVFNGRVIVCPDAQKTDASQSNKNLLLSDSALVNTNPQLEINADDVKCTHGATVGQLDEEMIFYMRSRGIGLEHARKLLIDGFVDDVSQRIRFEAVRGILKKILISEEAA